MISINTNLSSIIVQKNLKTSTNKLNEAIERMSTGAKLNHASDNAANYSISTNMNTKLSSLQVAQDNVGMGLDMVTTASESLNLVTDQLTRIRALAEQAANGTYGGQSLEAITTETNARLKECNRILKTTEYNGIQLFMDADEPEDVNRVSQVTSLVSGETYTIKDSSDLVALQKFVNEDGADTTGVKFVMTDDINMSGVEFRGIGTSSAKAFKGDFDGQGHTISNLTINSTEDNVGLFSVATKANIHDLKILGCNILGKDRVGAIIGNDITMNSSTIDKCYVTGNIKGQNYVGGFYGYGQLPNISNCYFNGEVTGNTSVGGIAGHLERGGRVSKCYTNATINNTSNQRAALLVGLARSTTIENCYCTGNISSTSNHASIIARIEHSVTIKDCVYDVNACNKLYASNGGATTINNAGLTSTELKDPTIMANYGFTEENGWYFDGGIPKLLVFKPADELDGTAGGKNTIRFQAGINGDRNSTLNMVFKFEMELALDLSTHESAREALGTIDGYLNVLGEQQIKYGAMANRLESALEANATQIANLTSSRSTIQDADIAKESSKYIREQILQQACATLLATANQTPAIALQLL